MEKQGDWTKSLLVTNPLQQLSNVSFLIDSPFQLND